MKTFRFTLAIVALLIGISACERTSQIIKPATPGIEDTNREFLIGVVLPLTGHLGATGQLMKQGYELALDELNATHFSDRRLKFITVDNTSTMAGAVDAFNQLIHQDGVSVILGPASSSATRAAFPIAQANQVVALSPTAGARGLGAIGDFVFRTALTTDIVIPRAIQATQSKLGYQRVATLYDQTDLFSTDRDETLGDTFRANKIEVLTTETFESGDIDFEMQLSRIKALNPDAIFVSALPPEKAPILVQARQLGITAPFLVSSLTEREVQAAGDAAEGALTFTGWLPTDDTPGNQAFIAKYRQTFGMDPGAFTAAAYAAVKILAAALQNAASTDSTAIRDALAVIGDLDTILGKFSFDANGNGVHEPRVMIVKNGALQPLEE